VNLAEAIESFNRKERNLLIRAMLGHSTENPLCLSEPFREQVAQKLELQKPLPPETKWWTDYHIDWLAGALARFVSQGEYRELNEGLVVGHQEDIDLVLATEDRLILIEAKGYRSFGPKQINDKLARLERLHNWYEKLAGKSARQLNFHILFASPRCPRDPVVCPPWACRDLTDRSRIPWLKLDSAVRNSIWEVTRCDGEGNRDLNGRHWQCCVYKTHRRKAATTT
jgi:hypothetical protein